MILENNDLAAPILILQLLKVATVVGSVEVEIYWHTYAFHKNYFKFIAGLLEGLDRTEPDRCGYIEAIRELHGDIRSPSDAEIENVSIKLLIMYNCELLHIAARVACLSSIKCLLTLGAQAIWSNAIGQPSLSKVSIEHRQHHIVNKWLIECVGWNFKRCVGVDPNDESVVYRTSKDENEEKNCRSLLLKETPIEFRPTLEQAGVSGACIILDDIYIVWYENVDLFRSHTESGTILNCS